MAVAVVEDSRSDLSVDPGYPDKAGFGRRVLVMSPEEAYAEM